MWFKNLSLYDINVQHLSLEQITEGLQKARFDETASGEKIMGFVAPTVGGALAFPLGTELMIAVRTRRKILPPATIKEKLSVEVDKFLKETGRKPKRSERDDLKHEIIKTMLISAFSVTTVTRAWISYNSNLLVIDSAKGAQCDEIINLLRYSLTGDLRMRPLKTETDPVKAMTAWVTDEPPERFTIDDDAVFSRGQSSQVRYAKTSLQPEDIRRQIDRGTSVTSLALTYDGCLSFTLDSLGLIRRAKVFGGLILDKKPADDDVTFGSDFLLMTHTYRGFLACLIEALGGVQVVEYVDDAHEVADGDDANLSPNYKPRADAPVADDLTTDEMTIATPLDALLLSDEACTDKAAMIVVAAQRASISLIQRHLRIGYNRAARIMEALEKRGVVSPENGSGVRTVLQ